MQLHLIAVGRSKAGPQADLFADYCKRLARGRWQGLKLTEVEEKRPLPPPALKAREAELIERALPAGAFVVALDERGKTLSSREIAELLGRLEQERRGAVAFLIGGAEGLDQALRKKADLVLSFGAMTWPHQLVRALLAEQIWRAETILTGHPYHRD